MNQFENGGCKVDAMEFKNEKEARNEIIRVMRIVAGQGLIRSSDGNISVRLDEDHFLVTPSGLYKMTLKAADLIIVDWQNKVVKGRPGLRPTSEILMHLEAYRQRKNIHAALHAHPPYATALTIAGEAFPSDIIPEVPIALGAVPIAEYATPGTPALAASIRKPIMQSDAVLLSHHGSLTVGRTLEEALIALERVEHTARSYFIAKSFGKVVPLPAEEMERLQEIGRRNRKEQAG
jgi:L-fuculose-phosphate aldolase